MMRFFGYAKKSVENSPKSSYTNHCYYTSLVQKKATEYLAPTFDITKTRSTGRYLVHTYINTCRIFQFVP